MIEILVVEDNPDEALLIKDAMEDGGMDCHVDIVHSAKGCFESDLSRYDLILLDYILPDMLGIEVLKRVLELSDVPVLMVTGMDATEIAVEALKIGAYDYIVKSDQYLESLPAAVEKVVEKYRLKLEAKRLQEELKKLSSVVEAMVDGVTITDLNGKITYVNRALTEQIGYKAEDLIGKKPSKFITEKDLPRFAAQVKDIMSGKSLAESTEYLAKHKDGKEIPMSINFSHLYDLDGKPREIVTVSRDISERKRAEEEIKNKNRELEDFAYTVSHDLKNPLWAIDGYSSAILEDYEGSLDEAGQDYLYRIRENAQKMVKFINSLLKYSRAGIQTDSFKEVDLSRVLKELLMELKEQIDEKRIELIIHELPSVFCDEMRMAQVFTNLIHNSIKFSKDKGSVIEVGYDEGEGEYQFYVKDNGVGFDKKDHDKIFGIFQHLNGSKDYQGNGIGLAIVKKVVESHGGDIWADSEKGKGATFYFTLPKKPNGKVPPR